jgi:hypothetical protein
MKAHSISESHVSKYHISDIKDPKVRNAIIMSENAWNKGVPFSRAIIEASTLCEADINQVVDYMLLLAEEKASI